MTYNLVYVQNLVLLCVLTSTAVLSASACNFPVYITHTCQSRSVHVNTCLSKDPATCSTWAWSSSQCAIIGVYALSDHQFVNNLIILSNDSDNLYPFNDTGFEYTDPNYGPTNLYRLGDIYLDNIVGYGIKCDEGLYNQPGACSVVGCTFQCDNGLNYKLSAISDGNTSGVEPQMSILLSESPCKWCMIILTILPTTVYLIDHFSCRFYS